MPRKPIEWTEEDLALLGNMTDGDIAKRVGLDITTVQRKRKQLGIPAHRQRKITWTEDEIAFLHTSLPHNAVAKRLGKTKAQVCAKRYELGIESIYPSYRKPAKPKAESPPINLWD